MKNIVLRLLFIIGISAGVFAATNAFFSDTETSAGNTFEAGTLDLLIDNTSYYNGVASAETTWGLDDLPGHLFFDFTDIKPDDWGEDTISLHVNDNPAWACMDISLTEDDDNSSTEPELADGDTAENAGDLFDGELGDNVNFIFWADDGDNVLEQNEFDNNIIAQGPASSALDGTSITLADSVENNIGGVDGDPLAGGHTYYIGKAWCFGMLTPDPVATGAGQDPTVASGIDCNGENLNNITQTDEVKADISFSAVQHRHNPNFRCDPIPSPTPNPSPSPVVSPSPSPSISPSPSPIACTEVFASEVVSTVQGDRKDGSDVLAARSIGANMLDAPNGTPVNNLFYSLGFGGTATLKFANPVHDVNGTGVDLSFHEITGGRPTYPLEQISVSVSADNVTYFPIGLATSEPGVGGDGIVLLDFSTTGLPSIQYVKVTDTSNPAIHTNDADGYDVDAIDATCGTI